MNIWNKVFLGIIFVTAIAVVVLTSVEMKIRGSGHKKIDSLEKRIEETDTKITKIVGGTAPTKLSPEKSLSELSFNEFRSKTIERYFERGRAWFGCIVTRTDERMLPPTLLQVEAQITITGPFIPSETGAETDVAVPERLQGVVYVFEEGVENNASIFLGRFNVDSPPTPTKFRDGEGNEKNGFHVTLITIDPISDEEIEQILDASKSTWAIYITPPVDRIAEIFDQLTEEEKQAIPEELREKFQPRPMPELTDAETEGVDPKVLEIWRQYRNEMDDPEAEGAHDFSATLDWLYKQRSSVNRDIQIAEADIETYKVAEEKAKAENAKLTGDSDLEEKRVEAMNVQLEKVKALLEEYNAAIDKMNLQIETLQALAQAYVAKIAEYQLKAVKKIEEEAKEPEQTQTATE